MLFRVFAANAWEEGNRDFRFGKFQKLPNLPHCITTQYPVPGIFHRQGLCARQLNLNQDR